jgi:YD repeat-containing protein
VDVQVLAPGWTSATSPADQFTDVPPTPVVTGLSRASGPATGGYYMVIQGSNFSHATEVDFGTTAITQQQLRILSDNAIGVTAPGGPSGAPVDVRVRAASGLSDTLPADQFTWSPAVPVLTGLSQSSGFLTGYYTLVLTGSNLTNVNEIDFGDLHYPYSPRVSDKFLSVTVPAHAAGTVDIRVVGPDGTSALTPQDQFMFVALAPVVSAVRPASGLNSGNYSVVVIGSFTPSPVVLTAYQAWFGGVPTGVSTVSFLSTEALLVPVPAYPTATVYPVASETVYGLDNGTAGDYSDRDPRTTRYAYTWFGPSSLPQSLTVTHPVVSTAQNGPGTPDTETQVFDLFGRPIWTRDGGGFLDYTEYDQGTGAITKTIHDVDTTRTGDFQNLPPGWTTPAGGGLHLITQIEVDLLGRTTKLTDPNGHVTYTAYQDAAHLVASYPGWTATGPTGPTVVLREDRGHNPSYAETLSAATTGTAWDPTRYLDPVTHRPTGGEFTDPANVYTGAGLQTLTRSFVNSIGHLVETDTYFNLTGVSWGVTPHLGTAGTNFQATFYGYDHHGRQDRVLSPTGTITRTVYDGLGRVVSTWVGTNDMPATGYWSPDNNTAPANMVQVSGNVYDTSTTPAAPGWPRPAAGRSQPRLTT